MSGRYVAVEKVLGTEEALIPTRTAVPVSGGPCWPFALLMEEAAPYHSHPNAPYPERLLSHSSLWPTFLERNSEAKARVFSSSHPLVMRPM